MSYVVGIDLGTSNTVAVIRSPDGRRRPVLFDGAPLMPSAVFLADDGHLAVGRDAQRLAQLDPGRYEPNPKRRIDEPAVLLGPAEIPTVQLLAAVLRSAAVGTAEITRTAPPLVLTYPASWGQTRRKTLHDAAVAAGWPDVSMVPEPVAAARYFISALNHPLPRGSAMVVYDFGGGTIDIAVVRNDPQGFSVIGSGGLEDVGGLDLDAALVDLLGTVLAANHPDVWRRLQSPQNAQDRRDRRLFWEDVRGAKEMLSRTTVAPVSVPGVETALHLTRDELESTIGPMIARTVAETTRVVRESGLQPSQLAGILLVGGSSRVPLVARMLHRELGVVPTVLEQPELPVAEGAVVHPSELTADGRPSVATGTATVAPRPAPAGAIYSTEAMSAMPVSGVPGVPVSAVPVSVGGAIPVSSIPVSASGLPSIAPVSPAVPTPLPPRLDPPRPDRRRLYAIVGGAVAALLVAAGVVWYVTRPDPIAPWVTLPGLPTTLDGGPVAVEGTAAAQVAGKVYVIGGLGADPARTHLSSVWVYDIAGHSWAPGPELPEKLSHTAAVADENGTIWVLGGWGTAGASKKVWTLKSGGTGWEEGPDLPEGRQAGAAVFGSKGIVYGGGTGTDGNPKNTVWELHDRGWAPLGTLSVAREKLTAATDRTSRVWFIGGIQKNPDSATSDVIDTFVNGQVQTGSNLKLDTPREGASAVYMGGIGLCVLGGHKGATYYDWWCEDGSKTAQLPKQTLPRAGMGVASAGSTIYTIAGYNTPKHLDGTNTVESFNYNP